MRIDLSPLSIEIRLYGRASYGMDVPIDFDAEASDAECVLANWKRFNSDE